MARDYAKPRNPNAARKGGNGRGGRGGPPPRGGGGGGGGALPGWVWLAVGLAIGAVVAAFAYIEKPQHRTRLGQDVAREGAEASPLVGQNRPAATARDGEDAPAAKGRERSPDKTSPKDRDKTDGKAPAAAPGNADVDRRYTFYNELQKIEVPIPREYAQPPPVGKTPPKPAPPEIREALSSPGAYLIQVGAYKSREEADRQRARLALLGYESRIEQGSSGTGLVFRVRIGPQSTLAAAQAVIARLDGNGVGSYLIKLKD